MRGREGVRWVTRGERGKHGEVSSFAGGRHKGESVGGFEPGVRRNFGWGVYKNTVSCPQWCRGLKPTNKSYMVFIDNLPLDVIKGALYKEFGKDGFISDVFISRKERRNSTGTFAFIRFNSYGGSRKAIQRLNGTRWGEANLVVGLPKYYRGNGGTIARSKFRFQPLVAQSRTQRWVEVKKPNKEESKNDVSKPGGMPILDNRVKEVQLSWEEDQKLRLQRSLLGVSVKPIDFRKVMDYLQENWKGAGTFESQEIRDEAMQSELLWSSFDEIRIHWEVFWCLSRRVWIEVSRMPVCLWSKEIFSRIAELWGKVIEFDDRAAESSHIARREF
ncbi:hypothetical protein PIB30_077159 [Stylosanthes scabra]|uniref:RRM domain-containing protein n=1 Tax=Stylosanthes scabra TaxID=79078 RepID=A0ABU6VP71_9FABA|nr:hypothetical protein [Stylosanthes scabra]